jgi:hypothetical protein
MKIKEVYNYPEHNIQLINMIHDGKEFAYSHTDNFEIFEVYHCRNGKPENGYTNSRSYNLSEGKQPPIKYNSQLELLKKEFNTIDWSQETK